MPVPVKRIAAPVGKVAEPMEKKRRRAPTLSLNRGAGRPDVSSLSLPAVSSVPVEDLSGYSYLIYGDRKIGKTTLASQFPDPFFLMFEPGGRALELKQVDVQSWQEFLQYITLLEQNPNYCKTIVIDTGYMAYERCHEYCLEALNLQDPRDEAWGNGWKTIDREFRQAHQRLFNLGVGIIITAHSELKEVKSFDGSVRDKLVTQLGKQATRFYAGIIDIIAYYSYDITGNRQLRIRGSEDFEAGNRVKGHFQFTDGTPITFIPMGNSEEDAFQNLQKAFYNQLTAPKGGQGLPAPVIRKGGLPLKRKV